MTHDDWLTEGKRRIAEMWSKLTHGWSDLEDGDE